MSEAWDDVDVLVYSHTCSAGVSYDKVNHFHKLFGVFSNGSCSPRDFHQMLKRVRKIEQEIIVYDLPNMCLHDNV